MDTQEVPIQVLLDGLIDDLRIPAKKLRVKKRKGWVQTDFFEFVQVSIFDVLHNWAVDEAKRLRQKVNDFGSANYELTVRYRGFFTLPIKVAIQKKALKAMISTAYRDYQWFVNVWGL